MIALCFADCTECLIDAPSGEADPLDKIRTLVNLIFEVFTKLSLGLSSPAAHHHLAWQTMWIVAQVRRAAREPRMVRALLPMLALSASLLFAEPTEAAEPDVSGTWTGVTQCPMGQSALTVQVGGKAGTFRHSYLSGKPVPTSTPVTVRFMTGHQGLWVYFVNSQKSQYHDGLLSPDGRTIRMDGMGACSDYVLTRNGGGAAGQGSAQGPARAPADVVAPSQAGQPNGEDIIQAMTNEWVGRNGVRLSNSSVRVAMPGMQMIGAVDLTFPPVRGISCQKGGPVAYDCRYTSGLKATMSPTARELQRGSPLLGFYEALLQKISSAPPVVRTHRFELGRTGWRSPTYRRELAARAAEASDGY